MEKSLRANSLAIFHYFGFTAQVFQHPSVQIKINSCKREGMSMSQVSLFPWKINRFSVNVSEEVCLEGKYANTPAPASRSHSRENTKQNIFLWLFCCKLRKRKSKKRFLEQTRVREMLNIKGRKASSNTSSLHVLSLLAVYMRWKNFPQDLSNTEQNYICVFAGEWFQLVFYTVKCGISNEKPKTVWMNPYQSLTLFRKAKGKEFTDGKFVPFAVQR